MRLSTQKKLDAVFSKYIRLRDSKEHNFHFFKCISCGKIKPFAQADCGHFINRRHMATRYCEKNCNAQCRACNRYDEGNFIGYQRGLIRKYGKDIINILEVKKNSCYKITEVEAQLFIRHYKKEIEKLKNEVA